MITRWLMRNWAVCLMFGAVMILLGLTLVGCSSYNNARGKGDAPVAGNKGEDSPATVTNMPDGFGNIATKCVAGAPGWRVFVTTNTSAAPSHMLVLSDKTCGDEPR